MNYLALTLAPGESWRYQAPADHVVAWMAVSAGSVDASSAPVSTGELAVFEESGDAIDFHTGQGAEFVLGSAAKHPHELAISSYSVHTNQDALRAGEAGIRRIGEQLRAQGRLG